MSGETNQYYCLRCRKEVYCDPEDEKNAEYIEVRRNKGWCRECFDKSQQKKEENNNAANRR